MSRKTFDFDDARDEMRDAIEAQDTEAIIRIFKMVRRHRDEAAKAHDVERRMRLERLMGQWLIKLKENVLLVVKTDPPPARRSSQAPSRRRNLSRHRGRIGPRP